eukprot:TRINITY_DN3083_c0_g1_i1.p1 TRINITY_DN3083_c0_g1~~TRINITY_DN3083_c0_g1_i1.p1  ORF type:complete len:796 (-),score=240.90 TRINITY_DN3083_c0_g1_i1:56-2443(-)
MVAKRLFVALIGCLVISQALALTTNIVPSQDVSFRNCEGVTSTSLGRTLDIYGSSCMNAVLRFDLRVLGGAALMQTSAITIELPILNAQAPSGMDLVADFAFSAAPGSWSESSNLATLSALTYGGSAQVTLIGGSLASISIPTASFPADLPANAVLEVRLSSSSSGAIVQADVIQIGSRRSSVSSQRARARVVADVVCAESATQPTTCLSASAYGFLNENAGFCIGGATGFCDCHSGMYGGNCALNATSNSQCQYADFGTPQNLATNFPPLIARDSNGVKSNRYENNRLILNIESPLVKRRTRTEMFLGNPTNTGYPGQSGCRYPGYFWNKDVKSASASFTPANDSLSCVEAYTAAIPWGTALQCGWNTDNNIKPGYTVYRSVITVQHTEQLPGLRGASVERNLQHIIPIQVAFPKTVTVSTNISVFSYVNLQAAIIAQKVMLPDTNGNDSPYGRIVLATSLQWPFTLTSWTFEDKATGARHTIDYENPQPTSEGSFNVDCLANAQAGNANPICNQLFGHLMLPLPNVCDLNGRYRYSFTVACRGDANNCPLGDANDPARSATVDVELKSEDFCAQIEIDIGAKGTLRVFGDVARTIPKSAFLFENTGAPQRAYFRADVSSDQATIQRAWIQQVAVFPSNAANNRNLLYTEAAGATSALFNFATTQGIDFAFFDVDIIPLSFPGVDVDANVQFTVEAVVGIEFEQPTFGGAKKRGIQYKTFTFDRRAVSAVDNKQQTAAAAAQIGLTAPRSTAPVATTGSGSAPQGVNQGGVTGSASSVVASVGLIAVSLLALLL